MNIGLIRLNSSCRINALVTVPYKIYILVLLGIIFSILSIIYAFGILPELFPKILLKARNATAMCVCAIYTLHKISIGNVLVNMICPGDLSKM